MAAPFPIAGPQIGQIVLYNNAGTVVAAMIYAVSTTIPSTWTVSLVHFGGGAITNVASAAYSPLNPPPTGTWTYPAFL